VYVIVTNLDEEIKIKDVKDKV